MRKLSARINIGESLIFITYMLVIGFYSYIAVQEKENVAFFKSKMVIKFGELAGYNIIFAFMFASKNSIWNFLIGLSFERGIQWHKICAYIT